MKTSSQNKSNPSLSNLFISDNCDCICHNLENIDINSKNSIMCQKITSNNTQKYSPSPMTKNIIQKKPSENPCLCDKTCLCSCHSNICLCCPCVKDNKSEYYKNLYSQIKSELEIEKRRSDRLKFDKEMNKQNFEKEKQNLILENNQLKQQLSETLALLEREEEKNNIRDEELYNFKNSEFPKLQQSYENLINSMKEEKDKQLNEMNIKIEELTKENISLINQLKLKDEEKIMNMNQIVDDLNIEINEIKNELETKNNIIDKLNNENDELNSHCEELKCKYNKEIQDLKNQNMKLNQNLNLNLADIQKIKDELIRTKKNETTNEQIYLKLKSGNEDKDTEINNLKRLLIEKEDEVDTLANELDKLKDGYNTLNVNYSEAAGQIEVYSTIEQKYNSLLQIKRGLILNQSSFFIKFLFPGILIFS